MDAIGKAAPFSLFISDLHLCPSRPAITTQFLKFLKSTAPNAESLYILGDFFEYWAGDDDLYDETHASIISGLKTLSRTQTKLYFMHGNRDFLLGQKFADATGINLLSDPVLLDCYGKRILLTHGDMFCTDDVSYQEFRRQVRNPDWQNSFLRQPLTIRKAQIEALRKQSETAKSTKAESIMDVNPDAVAAMIREHQFPELLIHGHTHRPAKHMLEIDGHHCERWVLGDWYEQGSYLILDENGCHSINNG